jgi:hypothetical protein
VLGNRVSIQDGVTKMELELIVGGPAGKACSDWFKPEKPKGSFFLVRRTLPCCTFQGMGSWISLHDGSAVPFYEISEVL